MGIYNLMNETTLLLSIIAFILGYNTLKSDLYSKIKINWFLIRFTVLASVEYFMLYIINNYLWNFFDSPQLLFNTALILAISSIHVPIRFNPDKFGLRLSLNNVFIFIVLLILLNKSDRNYFYYFLDVLTGLGVGFLIGEIILWINIGQPIKHPIVNLIFFLIASLILVNLQKVIFLNLVSAMFMLGFIMGNSMFGMSHRKQTKVVVNVLYYIYSLFLLIFLLNNIQFTEFNYLKIIQYALLTSISSIVIIFFIFLASRQKVREIYMNTLIFIFPIMLLVLNSIIPSQSHIVFFYFMHILSFEVLSRFLSYILNSLSKKNVLKDQNKSEIFEDFKLGKESKLPDFSYAGYNYSGKKDYENNLPVYNVTEFGIDPKSGMDFTVKVQNLIDEIGENGGGVIYFPSGKYYFNATKDKKRFISINHSNICIRGDNNGKTIFYSKYHTAQFDIIPWNSPALITTGIKLQDTKKFWGFSSLNPIRKQSISSTIVYPDQDLDLYEPEVITKITSDIPINSNILNVESTVNIKKNDVILIAMYNTSDDGNLIKKLLNRTYFTKNQIAANNAGIEKAPSFQWLVEVKGIINKTTLELYQPTRIALESKFNPVIAKAPMLRNICIENIHFKSGWDGLFKHHGFPMYYSNKHIQIMDYGYNAVKFCRVAHGYMKNVVIEDYTNPLCVEDSRNITVENIDISGFDGHRGIQLCCHSCDNLIRNINFSANFADMIGGDGNAYGNVFSNVRYWHYDNKYADIDFHGFGIDSFSPPAWNLFENFEGLQRIRGNGPEKRFPNCGVNNVFWNINSVGFDDSTEVFIYNPLLKQTVIVRFIRDIIFFMINSLKMKRIDKSTFPKFDLSLHNSGETHHSMYPDSIVAGYFSNDVKLTINGTNGDKQEYITIEALNNFVLPKSLYDEQVSLRKKIS